MYNMGGQNARRYTDAVLHVWWRKFERIPSTWPIVLYGWYGSVWCCSFFQRRLFFSGRTIGRLRSNWHPASDILCNFDIGPRRSKPMLNIAVHWRLKHPRRVQAFSAYAPLSIPRPLPLFKVLGSSLRRGPFPFAFFASHRPFWGMRRTEKTCLRCRCPESSPSACPAWSGDFGAAFGRRRCLCRLLRQPADRSQQSFRLGGFASLGHRLLPTPMRCPKNRRPGRTWWMQR